jgi:hypothetical protein
MDKQIQDAINEILEAQSLKINQQQLKAIIANIVSKTELDTGF